MSYTRRRHPSVLPHGSGRPTRARSCLTVLAAATIAVAGLLALPATAAVADPTPSATAPSSTGNDTGAAESTATTSPGAPASTPAADSTANPAATLSGHNPVGVVDAVRVGAGAPGAGINVTGWVIDPDGDDSLAVHVYVDKTFAGVVTANASRSDVGSLFGVGPNHGYNGTVAATAGYHQVCVYAINIGQGTGNPQLGCGDVVVSDNPFGRLDGASQSSSGLHVRGWGVDPNTDGALAVHVYSGSTFLGQLTANATRADLGTVTGLGDQHGFDGTIAVGGALNGPVCVYLINAGRGTNVQIGCQNVVYRSQPFGSLDAIRQAPGGVHVSGWAIDPGTSSADLVHFWSGSTFLGQISAAGARPDVEGAFPGWGPNHGFDQVLPAQGLSAPVCAYAINTSQPGGPNPQLGCVAVSTGSTPFGALDTAAPKVVDSTEKLTVSGWVIDPDTTAPVDVHVYVNGTKVGEATANSTRSDLGAVFPDYGANHGYTATFDAPTGSNQVCVYAINVMTGAGTNPTIGCRTVVINNNPVGAVTSVTQVSGGVRVVGWAIDPNTPDPVRIDLYTGSTFLKTLQADQPNADGARAYPAFGSNHGFDGTVTAPSGAFAICAYAINVGAGSGNPAVGCTSITTNFDPFGAVDSVVRSAPGQVTITGWAIDPDSNDPILVAPVVDNTIGTPITAANARNDVAAAYPGRGSAHGYSITVPVSDGEHTICARGVNVGPGVDKNIGSCLDLPDKNAVAPSPVQVSVAAP